MKNEETLQMEPTEVPPMGLLLQFAIGFLFVFVLLPMAAFLSDISFGTGSMVGSWLAVPTGSLVACVFVLKVVVYRDIDSVKMAAQGLTALGPVFLVGDCLNWWSFHPRAALYPIVGDCFLLLLAWMLWTWRRKLEAFYGRERVCKKCGYNLRGTIDGGSRRCPECGTWMSGDGFQWDKMN